MSAVIPYVAPLPANPYWGEVSAGLSQSGVASQPRVENDLLRNLCVLPDAESTMPQSDCARAAHTLTSTSIVDAGGKQTTARGKTVRENDPSTSVQPVKKVRFQLPKETQQRQQISPGLIEDEDHKPTRWIRLSPVLQDPPAITPVVDLSTNEEPNLPVDWTEPLQDSWLKSDVLRDMSEYDAEEVDSCGEAAGYGRIPLLPGESDDISDLCG